VGNKLMEGIVEFLKDVDRIGRDAVVRSNPSRMPMHPTRSRITLMKLAITLALVASLSSLAACGDSSTETKSETNQAIDSIGQAGRDTGQALGSAARDVGQAVAPAVDDLKKGANNVARSLACTTAKGADDAAGIAANC
jgi:hypothetical protein